MPRIRYIDIAKGIGILLVCIGHFNISNEDSPYYSLFLWIYSFHMPTFFFLSGMLFPRTITSIEGYVKNKSINLLVPYVLFSFFNLLIFLSIGEYVPNYILQGWGRNPLWFIPILFLVNLTHLGIMFGNIVFKLIGIVAVSSLFVWKVKYNGWLPYSLSELPWFYICFISGVIFNRLKFIETLRERKYLTFLLFSLHFILLFYVVIPYNPNYRLQDNDFLSYYYRYVLGMVGVLMTISFCMNVEKYKTKWLEWIGRNSMVILCVHYPYFKVLTKIDMKMGGDSLIVILLVFVFCFITILIYNRTITPLLKKMHSL